MFWTWTRNIIHQTRYISRSCLAHELEQWEILHCMDRTAELFNAVCDLILAYSRLLREIESCRNSIGNVYFSPVYPGRVLSYDSPQNEHERDLHSQHLYYKLVQVKLLEIQLELSQEYCDTSAFYKEWKCRDSFFKVPMLSNEQVDSAINVVKSWVEGGQDGKYRATRAFIEGATEYIIDGERKKILDDFGEVQQYSQC